MKRAPSTRGEPYAWLWDVDLSNEDFDRSLAGEGRSGFDRNWAMIRLIEYAPFSEIRRLLPRDPFIEAWPRLAPAIRSSARRQGMEFFRDWILGKRHLD
jgi:hypothetical protein